VSLQQTNSKNKISSILKLKVKSFTDIIEGIEDEITISVLSNSTYGEGPMQKKKVCDTILVLPFVE
jgi:hypothetical protein